MSMIDGLTYGGSATAVSSGLGTMIFAQITTPSAETTAASTAGLLVAIAGLAAAIGPQLQAALKVYLEERRAERVAKLERHDLANRLQEALLRIALLQDQISANTVTIDYNRSLVQGLAKSVHVDLPRRPLTDAEIDNGAQEEEVL